ncbi:MAG: MFS transporter [Actinomycetota bacterium]
MGMSATAHAPLLSRRTLPYYLGGFLGPFGTMVVISIYPELRSDFGVGTRAVNWSFSGYLLPMAALMLVSGTIGERFGRRRVLRLTFIAYAVASLLAAVAPYVELFVAARALQGVSNAFITPVLLAALVEIVPAARSGGAVGIYASFQAAGSASAPLIGGVAAAVDWRLAFIGVAVVAGVLATQPIVGEPRPGAAAPPIKPLLTRRMVSLWVASFAGAAGPLGAAVLVGLYLRDELGTTAAAAGAVLALGGACTALASPSLGRLLDRWGARRSAFVALIAASAMVAPLGMLDSLATVVVAFVAFNLAIGFALVILLQLAALAVPENRSGGVSSSLSFRFAGHAIGPLLLIPLFDRRPEAAFLVAAALGVVMLAAVLVAIGGAVRSTASSPAAGHTR